MGIDSVKINSYGMTYQGYQTKTNNDKFFDEVDKKNREATMVNGNTDEGEEKSYTSVEEIDTKDLYEQLAHWKETIIEKIENGETETKFQIGSQALTESEWDEMIERFDKAEKELQELVEEDIKEQEEKKLQESMIVKDSIDENEMSGKSEDDIKMEMLTSQSVAMERESETGEKELHVMWTTDEGMFCRKAGQESGYEWTIPFNSKEQRAKVEEILFSFKDDELPKEIVTKDFWDELFKKGLFN